MKPNLNLWQILLISIWAAGCASSSPPLDPVAAARLPMYGGMDRSKNPETRQEDENFFATATERWGSKTEASQVYLNQALRLYGVGNYDLAMKRFNQAWSLNPEDPTPYWGFAIIAHDQGEHCQARDMIDRSLELGLASPIQLADAGRIVALCALSDESLDPGEQQAAFTRSQDLYERAKSKDANNGYIYASWATAYFWRGEYARSWEMINVQRSLGEEPSAEFIQMLGAKMPDPSTDN